MVKLTLYARNVDTLYVFAATLYCEFVKTVFAVFAVVIPNLELLPSNLVLTVCAVNTVSANVGLNVSHITCIKHYKYFFVCNSY